MYNQVKPYDMAACIGETMWAERRHSAQLLDQTTSRQDKTDSATEVLFRSSSASSVPPASDATSRQRSHGRLGGSDVLKSNNFYGSTDQVGQNEASPVSDHHILHIKENGNCKRYASAPIKRLKHPVEKNLLISFIISLIFLIAALTVFCPTFAILLFALPVALIGRRFAACCCFCSDRNVCSCCCSKLLAITESQWLHETEFNKMVAHSLIQMEAGLEMSRIRDMIMARLIFAESESGKKLYPRFLQKIVQVYSGYAWMNDDDFSVDKHVLRMPPTVKTRKDLEEYIAESAAKEIELDKPPWEIHVATNVGPDKDTMILFRMHPALTDGISLVRIFCKSVSDLHSTDILKPRFGGGAIIFNGLRAAVAGPLIFLGKLIFLRKDRNILHGPPLSGKKVVAWSEPYSFPAAIRIKQVTRSTMNDVLVAAISGSLRIYMQSRGVAHPYNLHVTMPMDLRSDSRNINMGNHYAMFDIKLPTNTEGSIPRLWETKHELEELKNSADPVVMYGALHVLRTLLPVSSAQKIVSYINNKMTCVVSNLPGPDMQLSFAGRKIKMMLYWIPPRDQVGVSISAFSYGDDVRIAVLADEAVMPNPEILTNEFVLQMDNMSQLLANRRIPGERRRDLDEDAEDEMDDEIDPLEEEINSPRAQTVRHPSTVSSTHSIASQRTSSKSRPLSASLDQVSPDDASEEQSTTLPGQRDSMSMETDGKRCSTGSRFDESQMSDLITVDTKSPSGNVLTHEQLNLTEECSQYSPEVERKS
ncbi:uncharacterized protein LOC144355139 [Saccoglossus kowalevskii]